MNTENTSRQNYNILVIGNGFDLHHNMNTKYSDFIEFIKDYNINEKREKYNYKVDNEEAITIMESASKNSFIKYFLAYNEQVKGWIDFEILIKCITEFWKDFMIEAEADFKSQENVENHNSFLYYAITKGLNYDLIAKAFDKVLSAYSNYFLLQEKFKSTLYGVNRKEVIKSIRKEFNNLCEILVVYLKHFEPVTREADREITSRQIDAIHVDKVISFNYTDTQKKYGIELENVIYLHGSLEQNNIVLGFHDENEDELDFVYFKKYFQCIKQHTHLLKNFELKKEIMDKGGFSTLEKAEYNLYVFGHSLDITDKKELVEIFEGATKVNIFYQDEDDYEEKVIKLIGLLGKEEAVQKINNNTIDFIEIEKEPIM